ncbi:uncharacterized protein C16orf78 homolog isoform X2 [Microtus oregoni]|uniref:uncharacterized protein C16orf78 homolog isoform X2 n=1 Tax=Microtus oregoni TaxID=111838 RepID=UPI001BB198DD|nr:uncharacterized protein C16orf78 homolog isoform X2 [Microtus oregoni]
MATLAGAKQGQGQHNRHANMDRENLIRSQPYTKNYRQLRNEDTTCLTSRPKDQEKRVTGSPVGHSRGISMAEDSEDLMPTERKSVWRTAEERRMSDLTRVLEWLERRQGKKKRALQKKMVDAHHAEDRAKKGMGAKKKQDKDGHKVTFNKAAENNVPHGSKNQDPNSSKKLVGGYLRGYGTDFKGKHLNMLSSNFSRDGLKKSGTSGSRRGSENADLDIKDVIALETNTRVNPFRRQSSIDPILQETMFGTRRSGLMRDWPSKAPDNYDRKLKSLMEKGTEPKMETAKMLKPEEVLSCRYLRLSKNNVKTLIKLCKDAGMDVDIHPHMVESEIDSKKIFDRRLSTAL